MEKPGLWRQTTSGSRPSSATPGCETPEEVADMPEPQSPHVENGKTATRTADVKMRTSVPVIYKESTPREERSREQARTQCQAELCRAAPTHCCRKLGLGGGGCEPPSGSPSRGGAGLSPPSTTTAGDRKSQALCSLQVLARQLREPEGRLLKKSRGCGSPQLREGSETQSGCEGTCTVPTTPPTGSGHGNNHPQPPPMGSGG